MHICIYTSVEKIVTIEQLCTQTFFLLLCYMSMTDRKKGTEGGKEKERETEREKSSFFRSELSLYSFG